MPGPPPTPTNLKVIRGNPGKRALNHDEPQPAKFDGDPPDYLDDKGKAEWSRLVPILSEMRVLTAADFGTLANLCLAHQVKLRAQEEIGGSLTVTSAKGGTKADPAVKIMLEAAQMENQLAQQFGMTPAARSRVKVPKAPAKSDWDDLDQMRNSG